MKPRFVLDTDTIIDAIHGVRSVRNRLFDQSPEDLAITAMTVSELRFGAVMTRDLGKGMKETAAFIDELPVLPFTVSAALVHAEIRLALRKAPIGFGDLIIAATTLAVPATLISSNIREYGRVPGLQVESWR